jgi:hypothetical protein
MEQTWSNRKIGIGYTIFGTLPLIVAFFMWRYSAPLFGIIIAFLVGAGFVLIGTANFFSRRNWAVRIDAETINLVCPSRALGNSIELKTNEVVRIEHEFDRDGVMSDKWLLCTRSGERHEITLNVPMGAANFVREIEKIAPQIPIVETRSHY